LPGIKAINYNDKLKRAKIYGNSPNPLGRNRGEVAPSGSIEFYRRQWKEVLNLLTGGGAWGLSEKSWLITVQYSEVGMSPVVDILEDASINSPDSSNSEGTDASVVKCELDLMQILWDKNKVSISQKDMTTGSVIWGALGSKAS
jgi:hypothetical protein